MSPEAFIVFALLVALIVIAIANSFVRRGRAEQERVAPGGRPVEQVVFQRIIVPGVGAPPEDRAVTLACKIAGPDKATVEVLYVVEIPMALPLSAEMPHEQDEADTAIARSEVIGRRYGVEVRGMVAKSRFAGKAIVEAAEREGADLIVLASGAKRHGDWGRTSEYVLRNSPCHVIIERAVRS